MRTDYFDDLLPDSVTRVTQQNNECVTLELGNLTRENNDLSEASRTSRTSRIKTGNTEQNKAEKKRHAYRYRLHNGEGGGVLLTDEPDLGRARDNLAEIYGNRLVVVVRA